MTKTKRDLEALLRSEFGFSNRRSKAGAAAAWKQKADEDDTLPPEDEASAKLNNFVALVAAELRKRNV